MVCLDFITPAKQRNVNPFVSILPDHIINKIKVILTPITDIKERIK